MFAYSGFRSVVIAICLAFLCVEASGQGGWRQWEIHFRDGTSVQASPLAIDDKGRFTRSMGKEPGFERSKIAYFAIVRTELPPLPAGPYKQDQVVMLDGTASSGTITFRSVKFSEGEIVQNGKTLTLENVAYLIFADPKPRSTATKRKH